MTEDEKWAFYAGVVYVFSASELNRTIGHLLAQRVLTGFKLSSDPKLVFEKLSNLKDDMVKAGLAK